MPRTSVASRAWNEREDALLAWLYPFVETPWLAKRLGRSRHAVRMRANGRGIEKQLSTPLALARRFWTKVDVREPEQCWDWQSPSNIRGYGNFSYRGRRMILAHRAAWLLTYGPIDDGLYVLHQCDRRSCCNPLHLHLGTHGDNIREAVERQRYRRGEEVFGAKLTAKSASEIRRVCGPLMGAERRAAVNKYAARHGVHPATVRQIIRGQRWRHVL